MSGLHIALVLFKVDDTWYTYVWYSLDTTAFVVVGCTKGVQRLQVVKISSCVQHFIRVSGEFHSNVLLHYLIDSQQCNHNDIIFHILSILIIALSQTNERIIIMPRRYVVKSCHHCRPHWFS